MKKQLLFISTVVLLQMKRSVVPIFIATAFFLLPTISCAQKISGGLYFSLAICSDSTAIGFGRNLSGQLGNGTNINSNVAVPVNSLTGLTAVTAGGYHSLALRNDGTVWAWGSNFSGQLGYGNNLNSNTPLQVDSLNGIIAIAAGQYYSLALKNDSSVWAWGENEYGQLGIGSFADSNEPIEIDSLQGIIAISVGCDHSVALKNDGTVWAWGRNVWGQLGNGTNISSNIPVEVSSLSGIIAIATGCANSLALRNDGTLWAWGSGSAGALGNGNNNDSNIPVQVNLSFGTTTIAGSMGGHFLVLKGDSIWTWGSNSNGQLGIGTNVWSNVPVEVNSITNCIAIATGETHSIAQRSDGTLWAWGDNGHGQLGNGTDGNYGAYYPVQVIGSCQITTSCSAAFNLVPDTLMPHHYWALSSAMGVQPLTYLWDWGDGVYDSIAYPSHTFTNSGTHFISLTIHDSTGCMTSQCTHYELQKLSAENTIVKVDVVDSIPSIPTTIENTNVLQSWSVFPNPASGNSFINYTLSTPATVGIVLYDVLGNKLQQIVNDDQEQGEHNATIDARKLTNGVYVLQIGAGEQVVEEKIVILH